MPSTACLRAEDALALPRACTSRSHARTALRLGALLLLLLGEQFGGDARGGGLVGAVARLGESPLHIYSTALHGFPALVALL